MRDELHVQLTTAGHLARRAAKLLETIDYVRRMRTQSLSWPPMVRQHDPYTEAERAALDEIMKELHCAVDALQFKLAAEQAMDRLTSVSCGE
jgi:hypothetical protein